MYMYIPGTHCRVHPTGGSSMLSQVMGQAVPQVVNSVSPGQLVFRRHFSMGMHWSEPISAGRVPSGQKQPSEQTVRHDIGPKGSLIFWQVSPQSNPQVLYTRSPGQRSCSHSGSQTKKNKQDLEILTLKESKKQCNTLCIL